MIKLKILLVFFAVLINFACASSTGESNPALSTANETVANAPRKQTEPPVKTTVTEIVKAFSGNKTDFEKRFKGKVVAVEGKVKSSSTNAENLPLIRLNDVNGADSIEVLLRSGDEERLKNVGNETAVKIIGDIETAENKVSIKSRIFTPADRNSRQAQGNRPANTDQSK